MSSFIGLILFLGSLFFLGKVGFYLFKMAAQGVPPSHFGYRENYFLGRMSGIVKEGGILWLIPFLEKPRFIDYSLVSKKIEAMVYTKDRIGVKISGLLTLRPDPNVLDLKGRSRFAEISEPVWIDNIVGQIRAELVRVAGLNDYIVFIAQKQAIEDMINCLLRLPIPPHEIPSIIGVPNEPNAIDMVKFYEDNRSKIKILLENESKMTEKRSFVEEMYGIDIMKYVQAEIDFDAETKKAIQKEKQVSEAAKAADVLENKIGSLGKKLKTDYPEVSEIERLNTAMVMTGIATKKVIGIEGGGKGTETLLEINTDNKD